MDLFKRIIFTVLVALSIGFSLFVVFSNWAEFETFLAWVGLLLTYKAFYEVWEKYKENELRKL